MDIARWGKSGWLYLHAVTMSYPNRPTPKVQQDYMTFFKLVGPTLPCRVCQSHFSTYVNTHPPPVENGRDAMVDWLILAHNAVRRRQGKTELSVDAARSFLTKPASSNPQYPILVVGLTALLVTLVFLMPLLVVLLSS